MAVLTINWETLDKLPALEAPVVTTEAPADATPAEPAKKAHDKPFLVYVTGSSADTDLVSKIEKVILDDDRMRIGSKMFRTVKMTPEEAKADPVIADKGGKASPRLVVVSADLKTVKPFEGKTLSLTEIWGAMKAAADKHYKQALEATVKSLKDVLLEYDKVNDERKVLDDKEARAKEKPLSASDQKEIASKRTELDARQKKAEAKEKALFDLKVKAA